MKLKRFQNFVQVAELGSLSRAAEMLHIAQPALSRQMRLLEEELGVTLFTRAPQGMRLTEAGEELRARVIGPLRQLRIAVQDIRSLPGPNKANVILGMPPTAAWILASTLVRLLDELFPGIRLRIVEGSSANLFAWLLDGTIDTALLYDQPSDDRILTRDILVEELSLVGQKGKDATACATVNFLQLSKLPLILPGRGSSLRDVIENCAAKTKTVPDIQLELDSLQAARQLIMDGYAYTVLPSVVVHQDIAEGRLASATIVRPHAVRRLVIGSRSECQKPRAIFQIGELICEEISRLVSSDLWTAQLMLTPI